jgi:hypothetical protein
VETLEWEEEFEDEVTIHHGFSVPRLPFIDAMGKIARSDSPLNQIFGQKFKNCKNSRALQASWMQPMTGWFAGFVNSNFFKLMSAGVIMLNYYYIIYQTDFKMSHMGESEPDAMFVIEICFTAFYVWELCCQLVAQRKDFFLGSDKLWNLFDMAIVFVSVVELLVTLGGGTSINLSFLRVLRFLKISRVLRMFSALRLCKEIRIMVDALSGSFLIFVFCSIMLAMFYSIFAIFFVQGATAYLESTPEVDLKVLRNIKDDFGSVSATMLSLFMAISGGNDWSQYHETVTAVGTTYNFLFLFFIAFSSIAFLNVITGVFAEKALSLASPSSDELMVRRTEKERKDAQELVSLLQRVFGENGPADLGEESFECFLDHPEVKRYFEVRGMRPCAASRFFMLLLEIHQTETVDFGTFVSAVVKLDGMACSMDLHVLSAELKSMQLKHNHLGQFLKENLGRLIADVETKSDKMAAIPGQIYAHGHKPCHGKDKAFVSRTPADIVGKILLEEREETPSASSAMASTVLDSHESIGSFQEVHDVQNIDCTALDFSAPDQPSSSPELSSFLSMGRVEL